MQDSQASTGATQRELFANTALGQGQQPALVVLYLWRHVYRLYISVFTCLARFRDCKMKRKDFISLHIVCDADIDAVQEGGEGACSNRLISPFANIGTD